MAPEPPPHPAPPVPPAGWHRLSAEDCPAQTTLVAVDERESACMRADGQRHGPALTRSRSNRVKRASWRDGRLHGEVYLGTIASGLDEGRLTEVARFDSGRRTWPSWTFYVDGRLRLVRAAVEGRNARLTWMFDPSGQLVYHATEAGPGVVGWVYTFEASGRACPPYFVDEHGDAVVRRPESGDCDRVWRGRLAQGRPVGLWTLEVNGERVEEGRYDGGVRDRCKVGPWRTYKNGVKVREETWTGCTQTGVVRTWHPDGRRESMGEVSNGTPVGCWSYWHANGQLAEQYRYAWFDRYHTRHPVPESIRHGRHRRWDPEGHVVLDERVDASDRASLLWAGQAAPQSCSGWGAVPPARHSTR